MVQFVIIRLTFDPDERLFGNKVSVDNSFLSTRDLIRRIRLPVYDTFEGFSGVTHTKIFCLQWGTRTGIRKTTSKSVPRVRFALTHSLCALLLWVSSQISNGDENPGVGPSHQVVIRFFSHCNMEAYAIKRRTVCGK